MSWSGTKKCWWGDEPQDEVSDAVESKLGKDWWEDPESTPTPRRREVYRLLLEDKSLRSRVDVIYENNFGRPANRAEYRNLLRVGLALGGSTRSLDS